MKRQLPLLILGGGIDNRHKEDQQSTFTFAWKGDCLCWSWVGGGGGNRRLGGALQSTSAPWDTGWPLVDLNTANLQGCRKGLPTLPTMGGNFKQFGEQLYSTINCGFYTSFLSTERETVTLPINSRDVVLKNVPGVGLGVSWSDGVGHGISWWGGCVLVGIDETKRFTFHFRRNYVLQDNLGVPLQ